MLSHLWKPVAAAAVCTLSLVGIVIMLLEIDGIQLSEWRFPLDTSPNSVLAGLTSVSSFALIFSIEKSRPDEAGAHINIFRLRNLPRAALLLRVFFVLVDLFYAPLGQRLLLISERNVLVANINSTVSTTQTYSGVTRSGYKGNFQSLGAINAVLPAALAGLHGRVPQPDFSCPVANCTFAPFTSLGACSTCNNVTATTTKSCAFKEGANGGMSCNFTTPVGISVSGAADPIKDENGTWTGDYEYLNLLFIANPFDFSTVANMLTAGVFTFAVTTGSPYGLSNRSSGWQNTMQAFECRVDFCAQQYSNWSFSNGMLQQGNVQTTELVNVTDDGSDFYSLQPNDPTFAGNETFKIESGNAFGVNYQLTNALFTQSRNGHLMKSTAGWMTLSSNSSYRDNMQQRFQDMATGISYAIMAGPDSILINGPIYATRAIIEVQWPWIALLAALDVVGLSFVYWAWFNSRFLTDIDNQSSGSQRALLIRNATKTW